MPKNETSRNDLPKKVVGSKGNKRQLTLTGDDFVSNSINETNTKKIRKLQDSSSSINKETFKSNEIKNQIVSDSELLSWKKETLNALSSITEILGRERRISKYGSRTPRSPTKKGKTRVGRRFQAHCPPFPPRKKLKPREDKSTIIDTVNDPFFYFMPSFYEPDPTFVFPREMYRHSSCWKKNDSRPKRKSKSISRDLEEKKKKKEDEVPDITTSEAPTIFHVLANQILEKKPVKIDFFDTLITYFLPENSCKTFWDEMDTEICDFDYHMPAMKHSNSIDDEYVDDLCFLCLDGTITKQNDIIYCDGCAFAAHQKCCNVSIIPEGDWYCNNCKALSVT